MWSKLTTDLQNTASLKLFMKNYKTFLLNSMT